MADKFIVAAGTDAEREFDMYHHAYDYALGVYAENRVPVPIKKGTYVVYAGDPVPASEEDNSYNSI